MTKMCLGQWFTKGITIGIRKTDMFYYERVRLSPHLAQTDFALFFYIFKTALTEILGSK